MRFLFLALDVDLSLRAGDTVHTLELARNLAVLNHQVDLVVENYSSDAMESRDVRIHATRGKGTASAVRAGLRICHEIGADIVYERRLTPKVGISIAALSSLPFAVEINGVTDKERALLSAQPYRPSGFRHWARTRILTRAQAVITVSPSLKKILVEDYQLDSTQVHVIPNGVNLELFRPLSQTETRRDLGFPSDISLLGFVGHLNPWQGVDLMLRLLAEIRKTAPDVRGVVVGDGPDRARLEEYAKSLGLGNSIRFEGSVPYSSVPEYISTFDVAMSLKPPLLPGSPLKVREYMACGRPVIASQNTEYDFGIVEDARAGLLINPVDIRETARATLQLIEDEVLRKEMGIRGRGYAEAHCFWLATAQQVAEACSQ